MRQRGLIELRRKVERGLFVNENVESEVLVLALWAANNSGHREVNWRVTSASPTLSGASIQARIRMNGVTRAVTFYQSEVDAGTGGRLKGRVEEICREGLFDFGGHDEEFRKTLKDKLRVRRSRREFDALAREILVHASCVRVPADQKLLELRDKVLAAALAAARKVTPQQVEAVVLRQAKKKAARDFRMAAHEACKSPLTDQELRRILDEERVKSVLE